MKKDKKRKFNLDEKVALTVNNPAQGEPLYCDLTAEKLLLRSMLTHEDYFLLANDKLNRYSFSDAFHQEVFLAMRSSFGKNKRVGQVNVCHELGMTADSKEAKGVRALADFKTAENDTGQLSEVEFLDLIDTVHGLYHSREVLRIANRFVYVLLEHKQEDKFDATKPLAEHIDSLFKMEETFVAEQDSIENTVLGIRKAIDMRGKKSPLGLLTGIRHLDRKLNGFHPGEMITFIATPGTGKSALMLSALHNMVFNEGNSCVYVSFEMSQQEILNRLVEMGLLQETPEDFMLSFIELTRAKKFRFLDAVGMNIRQLHSKLLLMHRKSPLDCIFVDYLNNIPSVSKTYSKNARIAEVSDGLRTIAHNLKLPLVTAAQVDKVAARDARVPVLADIRDATEVADHSHKVVSIFRPSVHEIMEYSVHGEAFSRQDTQNLAILTICKNRGGMMGTVYAHFNAKATYFSDWPDENVNFDPNDVEHLSSPDDALQPPLNGIHEDDVPF